MFKPDAHFRSQFSLAAQTGAETAEFHKRLEEIRDQALDKIHLHKQAVILQAAGMTEQEARQQIHRFQMAFTADGVEHVFMDGEPLVDFMPGRIEDGHWKAPYRLCHRGSRP